MEYPQKTLIDNCKVFIVTRPSFFPEKMIGYYEVDPNKKEFAVNSSRISFINHPALGPLFQEQKNENKKGQETYTFSTSSPSMLDFEEVAENLTPKKPIILLTDSEGTTLILIHKRIAAKAKILGTFPPKPLTTLQNNHVLGLISGDITKKLWIDWVKRIKYAPYPEEKRKQMSYKVYLLEI